MPRITVGTENNAPIEIHYEDHGSGQPVVADVTVVPLEGGPHNIGWTHPEEVNGALLGFLMGTAAALESAA